MLKHMLGFALLLCCACSSQRVKTGERAGVVKLQGVNARIVSPEEVDNDQIVPKTQKTPLLKKPSDTPILSGSIQTPAVTSSETRTPELKSEPNVSVVYTWRMLNERFWNEPTPADIHAQLQDAFEYCLEIALDFNLKSQPANERLAQAGRDIRNHGNPRWRVSPDRPWNGGAPSRNGEKYIAGHFDSAHVYRRP